jgi:putative ABC transport system permease protein
MVIIDAATADILGLSDPVGEKILSASLREVEILGVVDNTDLIALKGKRKPFLYTQFYNLCSELIIHYEGDPAVIAGEIAAKMVEFDPEFEFNFRTVAEARDTLYLKETNQVKIVLYVGLIAIILTIVGAYSMASYLAERRSREITIRKVMGATVREVLQVSFREMFWMIIIAFIIASPIAYYVSSKWLENFTQKISIGPMPFIFSVLIILLLIFITVIYKERQAAMTNPVDNLRQQ